MRPSNDDMENAAFMLEMWSDPPFDPESQDEYDGYKRVAVWLRSLIHDPHVELADLMKP